MILYNHCTVTQKNTEYLLLLFSRGVPHVHFEQVQIHGTLYIYFFQPLNLDGGKQSKTNGPDNKAKRRGDSDVRDPGHL